MSIGADESYSLDSIAQTIKLMVDRHPKLHIAMISGYTHEILEKLDSGLLDFSSVIGDVSNKKYAQLA